MKFVRSAHITKVFAILTGIVFLNMSFFLAEVSALKIEKDKVLFKNICKLVAGSSAEEEQGAFGGYADEDSAAQGIDFVLARDLNISLQYTIISDLQPSILELGIPRFGNYEIYSPPPEV